MLVLALVSSPLQRLSFLHQQALVALLAEEPFEHHYRLHFLHCLQCIELNVFGHSQLALDFRFSTDPIQAVARGWKIQQVVSD